MSCKDYVYRYLKFQPLEST